MAPPGPHDTFPQVITDELVEPAPAEDGVAVIETRRRAAGRAHLLAGRFAWGVMLTSVGAMMTVQVTLGSEAAPPGPGPLVLSALILVAGLALLYAALRTWLGRVVVRITADAIEVRRPPLAWPVRRIPVAQVSSVECFREKAPWYYPPQYARPDGRPYRPVIVLVGGRWRPVPVGLDQATARRMTAAIKAGLAATRPR